MPPLRRVKKDKALQPHWVAALKEIRSAAVRNGFKGSTSTIPFFPYYTSAKRYFKEHKKTVRSLYETWACLHLCARHGDPFAARAIARVLTQRLRA